MSCGFALFALRFKLFYFMKQSGLTIIELIVVIAVVAALVIIVISNFPQIKLQFALSRVSYKFDQDLRKAQNLASSSVQYTDSSGNIQIVNGYGIYLHINSLGGKKYIIYADKPYTTNTVNGIDYPVSNGYYDSSDYVVEIINLNLTEPGIIIKEINTPDTSNNISVDFNSSDLSTIIGVIEPYQNKPSAEIVFALESDLTKTRTVVVNSSGSVTIK